MLEKILISSCFLGCKVRYNGEIKPLNDNVISRWHKAGRLIAICPEVAGGLLVPRLPAEMNQQTSRVITSQGQDVTKEFMLGASKALLLCQQFNIRYALLKESSPSCGSSMIYDGTFSGKKILGQGLTAQLLRENGVEVFSENTIDNLFERIERAKGIDSSAIEK